MAIIVRGTTTNPLVSKIQDATTGTQLTIKAGSASPVAADSALVVAISPNTPIAVTTTAVIEGQFNTVLPTLANGAMSPLQMTNKGVLLSAISDPISGNGASVQAFHNADNQSLGGTAYGILAGGVAQLLNPEGNLDRQRETAFDNIPGVGVATGTQQLASPFSTSIPAAITASGTAQAVTPAAMSGSNNGSPWSIQVGHSLRIDTGISQEIVFVTAVTATTFTAIFTKSHAAGATVAGFAYNQARDASVVDGALGTGMSAGATYLFNAILNGGAGGWERERSASGELDNASGTGTAVAAEYEFNGISFDRARSVQGKGYATSAITAGGANGSSSLTVGSTPAGLTAGQQVRLFNGTTYEANWVTATYTPGTTIPLQNPIANGTHTTLQYELFSVNGPGLNGFMPAGIGIEEEALWDPVSNLFYIERAATQDGMPAQNIVAEAGTVWNGTGFDRIRGVNGDAMPQVGIEASADLLWNGASFDRPRSAVSDALPTTGVPAESEVLWNGTSFDRARANTDTAALATLTAASTGGNSPDLTNVNGRGVQLGINVTAITGTGASLVVTVQGKDAASGVYYTLLQSAAITAAGFTLLTIYPGTASVANASSPQVLPRTYRILYTIAGTTPAVTATVGASVIV